MLLLPTPTLAKLFNQAPCCRKTLDEVGAHIPPLHQGPMANGDTRRVRVLAATCFMVSRFVPFPLREGQKEERQNI